MHFRRPLLVVALLALLWTVSLGTDSLGTGRPAALPAPLTAWSNPVIDRDFPDPSVLRVGASYWAVSTASAAGAGFPLMRSEDAVHWFPAGQVFPVAPGWATDSFWAPELRRDPVTRGIRVLYSARRGDGRLCVALATAPVPTGPYADRGPLVCDAHGSIDPTEVADRDGSRWLVWKEDGNSAGEPTRIWAQREQPDGLGLVGPRHLLLRNEEEWEGSVVEAPEIVVRRGFFYLFYSGSSYGGPRCGYALGVARSRRLLGPYLRHPTNPVLASNAAWRCPGHATFFDDGEGHELVMYHAYRPVDRLRMTRVALLDEVTWGRGGWPVVARGRGPSGRAGIAPR